MKRLSAVFLCFALSLCLCQAALADVAFEPQDSFYSRHSGECNYENRNYYINGGEGYALVYSSPESKWAEAALRNGEIYYVSHTIDYNGETWGCIGYNPSTHKNEAWGDTTGWLKIADMYADYDAAAFDSDHSSEYLSEARTLLIGKDDLVCTYKYPGSGLKTGDIGNYTSDDSVSASFEKIFIDPDGREWGYIGYFYGNRNVWVCLSDPYNNKLPADSNCVSISTKSDYPQNPVRGKIVLLIPAADSDTMAQALSAAKAPTAYIIAGAAALVIIAAGLIIFITRRKQASK